MKQKTFNPRHVLNIKSKYMKQISHICVEDWSLEIKRSDNERLNEIIYLAEDCRLEINKYKEKFKCEKQKEVL